MFIMRTSSDVQLEQFITTYYALCMLPVLILAALNYHIHNPYRLLSIGQECRSTFAGVIFEDTNQDGAFGLNENTLDGLVTLRSKTDATIQKYETERGYFISRNMLCGVYEVSYEDKDVGEIEIKTVMSGEVYSFAGTHSKVDGAEHICYIYLPYIAR